MADQKYFRPQFFRFGVKDHFQTITTTTAASALQTTTILGYGVTLVDSISNSTTGTGHTVTLDEPRLGVRKTIVVHGPGTSTVPMFLQTNSSAVTVGETTVGNRVTFSTTCSLDGSVLELVGLSSVAWILGAALPSGATIATSTQTV